MRCPSFSAVAGTGQTGRQAHLGGLVGIYDYPELMDGGFVTAPRLVIVSPDGEWEVENEGVAPDVEVDMMPKAVIAGHDPQLEKAVELILAELDADCGQAERPAPPNRVARPTPPATKRTRKGPKKTG